MEFLVLGGTAWLGREVTRAACARGHAVTCVARGTSGEVAQGARLVVADRDRPGAYHDLLQRRWDAVVDVARQPGQVRGAVDALEPVADRYLFVSSSNVYADQREHGQDETAPLLAALDADVMNTMEQYGAAKVACERAVVRGFGASRSLIARAGLIGGPGDPTGRSTYWPWRFAHPSNHARVVLVPDDPQMTIGLIDMRDLAAWLIGCAEARTSGTFDAAGPPLPLADHLAVARRVGGHTGPLAAATPAWLREHGVQGWMGVASLPLWIDDSGWHGMHTRSSALARAAGLSTRPLQDTLADALTWERNRPHPGPHGAGLTDEEERRLLAAFHANAR